MPGVNLAAAASLVAFADLKAVQAVLGAMHRADAEEAGFKAPGPQVPGANSPAKPIPQSCDRYEGSTRVVTIRSIQPSKVSPCCQPGRRADVPEIHHQTRLALLPENLAGADGDKIHSCSTPSPIQAPWKVLPWQQPPKQVVQVKVVQQHTDILTKGSLIDMFI